MMVAIFAAMTAAFGLQNWGRPRFAVATVLVALALGLALFLWEVDDPQRGFAMPWLNVERSLPAAARVPA